MGKSLPVYLLQARQLLLQQMQLCPVADLGMCGFGMMIKCLTLGVQAASMLCQLLGLAGIVPLHQERALQRRWDLIGLALMLDLMELRGPDRLSVLKPGVQAQLIVRSLRSSVIGHVFLEGFRPGVRAKDQRHRPS